MLPIDHTGKRFTRWTVISRQENNRHGAARWLCRCDCGTERTLLAAALVRGHTKSCGCLQKEGLNPNHRHGHATGGKISQTYHSWASMIARCTNPNNKRYADWGGRGIKVCDRWMDFRNFLADMGEKPEGTSIDRIDNEGHYTPENCRWATIHQQVRNRRPMRAKISKQT